MQRLALLIAVSVLGVAAAGCGGAKITLPPVAAAPPQQVRVDWLEPTDTKSTSPRLIFEVKRIEVGDDGWKADVAIRNETEVPWALGGPTATSSVPFGVMLFATGDHEELEQRVNQRELPGVRDAHTAQPPPPEVLEPGATWEGTVAAPGALAAGRWLRIVFGPLFAQGSAPDGMPNELTWISDNAYRLLG